MEHVCGTNWFTAEHRVGSDGVTVVETRWRCTGCGLLVGEPFDPRNHNWSSWDDDA